MPETIHEKIKNNVRESREATINTISSLIHKLVSEDIDLEKIDTKNRFIILLLDMPVDLCEATATNLKGKFMTAIKSDKINAAKKFKLMLEILKQKNSSYSKIYNLKVIESELKMINDYLNNFYN